jgi:putative oxidoreductase
MAMILFVQRCVQTYDKLLEILIKYTYDILLLIVRIYVASIFFQAGWNKFDNLWQEGWFKTIFLFKHVHPVPFLSAELAAALGTGAEVIFSILLTLGVMARIGALGLLGVTAVITFGVHSHFTHVFWALLLSVSLIMGPGRFSFDGWLRQWWNKRYMNGQPKEIIHHVAPVIIPKDTPNRKITLDNKKEPAVKRHLKKQKLIAEPEEMMTVKSLLTEKRSKKTLKV